jgi:hypothetical protein
MNFFFSFSSIHLKMTPDNIRDMNNGTPYFIDAQFEAVAKNGTWFITPIVGSKSIFGPSFPDLVDTPPGGATFV